MNVGIFAVITLVERIRRASVRSSTTIRGLIYRSPLLGSLLIFFLISLIGIPFTGGFFGKFYSFYRRGRVAEPSALAIIGLLNSGLAAAYYLRLAAGRRAAPDRRRDRCARRNPQVGVAVGAACAGCRRHAGARHRSGRSCFKPRNLSRSHICKRASPCRNPAAPVRPTAFRYNFLNEARRIGKPAGRGTPRRRGAGNHRRQRN